jgi:hypothetical protein
MHKIYQFESRNSCNKIPFLYSSYLVMGSANRASLYSSCSCFFPAAALLLILSTTPALSSLSVTHTQNQAIISMKIKVKKTRFLRLSPPHEAAEYEGL